MMWVLLTVYGLAWISLPILYGIRIPSDGPRPAGLDSFEYVRNHALIVALFSLWHLSTGELLTPWHGDVFVVTIPAIVGFALRGRLVDEDVIVRSVSGNDGSAAAPTSPGDDPHS